MTSETFDALTRETGIHQDRRTSLKALGAAALLAAVAGPLSAQAKQSPGKKAKKKCKKQVGQCVSAFNAVCEAQDQGVEVCLALVQQVLAPCCQSLRNCGAGEFVTCVFSQTQQP